MTDSNLRQAYSCVQSTQTSSTTPAGGQEINLSNPAMQCEDHRMKMDAGAFLLGLLLNFYICWIVYSYEKTVRDTAAIGDAISGESPA